MLLPIRINRISILMLVFVSTIYTLTFIFQPRLFFEGLLIWSRFFMFFLPFVVAVIALVGLFDAYVSPEFVSRHLGRRAGAHGYFLAMFLGILATASEYAVYPTMVMLKKKGALTSILAVFLVAWSGISFPVLPLEIQIFGPKFTFIRVSLILLGALIMGLLTKLVGIEIEKEN